MSTCSLCRQSVVDRSLRRSAKFLFPLTIVALVATMALPVAGQTTAPAPAESATPATNEVLALSPFQVDATKDSGYAASNTQAGSRLNSRLIDTPSAIS